MSQSLGRDPATDELLSDTSPALRLVFPAACFMESFSAYEAERKRSNRIVDEFRRHIQDYERNVVSPHASPLIEHLERSLLGLGAVFDETRARFFEAIRFLRTNAEIIDLTTQILDESLSRPLIDDPTDNLILASLLSHAASQLPGTRAFISENRRDFQDKRYPKAALDGAGIKYFAQASKFLEWHRSQAGAG